MTDATSKPIGDKSTTGEPTGAHSPLVAPTETEAPDLGASRGERDGRAEGAESAGRRESVPGAVPPGREGRLGRDSAAGGDRTSALRGSDGHDARLLPHDECDKLSARLQHAVAGFVDEPRSAVEEADHVLEEVAARFADAVKQRRRTLRNSWQAGEGKAGDAGDTEQLRLALRDYRELTERLLHS
ncbi:hypothetical protein [Streptomyces sp. NPDC057253]|uniref:hypothetical protein n=1 Tax=Streptomyces sp. NPDC057253 TaxID=3346069 RepID=UPI00362B7752